MSVPSFWSNRSPKCPGKFHLCRKILLYTMMPYLELGFEKANGILEERVWCLVPSGESSVYEIF